MSLDIVAIDSLVPKQYEIFFVLAAATLLFLLVSSRILKRYPKSDLPRRDDRPLSAPGPGNWVDSSVPGTVPGDQHRLHALLTDLRADNNALRSRIAHLTNMNSLLAPLVKELNSNMDRRRMGPLVLRILARIFNPGQALVFLRDENADTLTLVAQTGVVGIQEGLRIQVGEGFAGMVAQKRVAMCAADLQFESNLVRKRVELTEPKSFATEVATPILYMGELLGVLCMGRCSLVDADLEVYFGMISDLVGMALANYRQYRQIQEFANQDTLTKIHNKGYFLERCGPALAEARRTGVPMSVIMIDVDAFKHYNDTNGHLAGDEVLRTIAAILRRAVRECDLLARFGGEEFVILLHSVAAEEAYAAAERIREAVAAHPFPNCEGQPLGTLTISGGVAGYPENGPGPTELVDAADKALYEAKAAGRNRIVAARSRLRVEPGRRPPLAESIEKGIIFRRSAGLDDG